MERRSSPEMPLLRQERKSAIFFQIVSVGLVAAIALIVVSLSFVFGKPLSTTLLSQTKYFFIPAKAIRYDPIAKHEVLAQEFSHLEPNQMRIFHQGDALYELVDNQTIAPPGAYRSCAISSLELQAQLVINGWNKCGYMLDEGDDLSLANVSGAIEQKVISAPPNRTQCTPNQMGVDRDCVIKFVRTLWRNDPKTLQVCLSKVRGVSQTCKAYKSCGPRVRKSGSTDDNNAPPPGVCNTPSASYFREVLVLRMCGICDMFGALMPADFESPSAFFAYSIPTSYYDGGRKHHKRSTDWTWAYFVFIPLAAVGLAALVFVCLSSVPGSPFRPSE